MYQDYGRAIRTGDRDRIARFYSSDGARRIINGQGGRLARATIDSMYRYRWNPPAFFAWDSLQFEVLPPARVLVFGRFRWLGAAGGDTSRYAYAAILEADDSGLTIRFEHETGLPPKE